MRYWFIDVSEADVLADADQTLATAGEGMKLSGLAELLRRLDRYAPVRETGRRLEGRASIRPVG